MVTASRYTMTVAAGDAGGRLDRILAASLAALSRTRLQVLIADGAVTVDGVPRRDASYRPRAGARIAVTVPPARDPIPQPEALSLAILYEDPDLIVIEKPAGMVVHPAPGNPDRTLVNALLAHCGDALSGIGGVRRPGIVHRLDKDTSGVMIAAKTDRAHQGLAAQFAAHSIERAYRAVVHGVPAPARGVIDKPIGRSKTNRKRMAVSQSGGKPARTTYALTRVLANGIASIVNCHLGTGRTHQIRVHLASIGHPVIGDPVYGSKRRGTGRDRQGQPLFNLSRQALHAYLLGFEHPICKTWLQFESETPHDINKLINSIENS